MVRREGWAEFPSHHAQGLPMGHKQHDMTRYWSLRWMVRRERWAELSSHHVQGLHMGHKQHDMTRYWQYCVGQTIHAYLHAWKWVKVSKLAQVTKLKLAVDGKEGMAC